MDVTNKCRKFEANMFNKLKCQNCFKGKEDHSSEALECNRNSRKVCLCGYLFVAPETFNFANSLDRTKRWQRRFFILYDDGELTYSVDENVNTIPQGTIDMSQCGDVFSAQDFTGHQYSIGISSPEKITYVKGTTKEEINRWQDLLVVYPQNLKSQRPKRLYPNTLSYSDPHQTITTTEIISPVSLTKHCPNIMNINNNDTMDSGRIFNSNHASTEELATTRTTSYVLTGSQQVPNQKIVFDSKTLGTAVCTGLEKAPQTFRGVRSMKHKNDKSYADNLRKSSSLQNLTSGKAVVEEHPHFGDRSSSIDRISEQQTRDGSLVGGFRNSSSTDLHGSHPSLGMTNYACVPVTPKHFYKSFSSRASNADSYASLFGYQSPISSRVAPNHLSPTRMELEKFNNTNIVSNATQIYEQMSSDADATTRALSCSEGNSSSRVRRASSSPFRTRQPTSLPATESSPFRTRPRTVVIDQRQISTESSDSQDMKVSRRFVRGRSGERNNRFASSVFPASHITNITAFTHQNRNETDEFKMSKSSPDVVPKNVESNSRTSNVEDLMYVKKGWLMKQAVDKSWQKCWCVLSNMSLTYYSDSKKTETVENVEGVIVLTPDTEVHELNVSRNFAFRIANKTNEYVLAAMTSGICSSWMHSILRCVDAFSDAATPSDLTPSALDSTSNRFSWKSCPASDSDADSEAKSKDSLSSWSSYQHDASAVMLRSVPLTTSAFSYGSSTAAHCRGQATTSSSDSSVTGAPTMRNNGRSEIINRENSKRKTWSPRRTSRAEANAQINNENSDERLGFDGGKRYSMHSSERENSRVPAEQSFSSRKNDIYSSSQFRGPSTRIMERTRAKSPKRAKSPPPCSQMESVVPVLGLEELPSNRQNPMENFEAALRKTHPVDNSLIELMECEMATLKRRLDFTQSQLEETQAMNTNLRSKLVKTSQENQNLSKSFEVDKHEYLSQVNQLRTKLSETSSLMESQRLEVLELQSKIQQMVERERSKVDKEQLEMESLRRELSEKTGIIQKLETEIEAMQEEMHNREMQLEVLEQSWTERNEAAKSRWMAEKKALEMRLQDMEMRLDQSEMVNVENLNLANSLRNQKAALTQLEDQIMEKDKKLQCTLTELELEMEDNTRIHKELDEYCKENATLQMRLQAEAGKSVGLEADIRHLREEKQELIVAATEKDTKNVLLRQDVERVESQLKELVGDNARLMQELQMSGENESRRKELEVKENLVQRIRIELDKQLEEHKKAMQRLEELEMDKQKAESKVVELEGRLSIAETNVKSSDQLKDNFLRMKEENDGNQDELTNLKELLKRITGDLELERKNSEELKAEKDKQILQIKCEFGELFEQQKTLRREFTEAQTQKTKLRNESLELKAQLKTELESKHQEAKQYESKIKDLACKLEAQNMAMESQRNAENTGSKPVEASEARDHDLKEKYTFMARQVKRLQIEQQQAESRYTDLESTNKQLRQDIRNLEVGHADERERLGAKVQELTTKLTRLEMRNCRLEQKSRSAGGSRSDDTEEVQPAKNDSNDLGAVGEAKAGCSIEVSGGDDGISENRVNLLMKERDSLLLKNQELEEQLRTVKTVNDETDAANAFAESDLVRRLEKEKEEHQQQQEQVLSDMKDEMDRLQVEWNKEVEQLEEELEAYKEKLQRQDNRLQELELKTGNTELGSADTEEKMTILRAQIEQLQKQLINEQQRHEDELRQLRNDPNLDPALASQVGASLRIEELKTHIQDMKSDYEHELAMQRASHRREMMNSKEEIMQQLAAAEANSIPIDEESIRKTYMKEVEQIKDMYDKGFSNMEKSHQRMMMDMRRNHKVEMDRLQQEKDQLLKEETLATQAALEAMKKAHESELQKERNKFLDLIAKTYSHADIETLQRQHEEDSQMIQYEMRQLSERVSIKCLENAALTERLEVQTKSLHESRRRVQDLLVRNEELNLQLKFKVDRLNRILGLQVSKADAESGANHGKEELTPTEVKLQVTQMEVEHLQNDLETTHLQLQIKIEELKECNEKYHELYEEMCWLKKHSGNVSSSSSKKSIGDTEHDWVEVNDLLASTTDESRDRLTPDEIDLYDDSRLTRSSISSRLHAEIAREATDVNPGRRSSWRFKNPLRARSNPTDSRCTDLQKSLAADPSVTTSLSSTPSVLSISSAINDLESTE